MKQKFSETVTSSCSPAAHAHTHPTPTQETGLKVTLHFPTSYEVKGYEKLQTITLQQTNINHASILVGRYHI